MSKMGRETKEIRVVCSVSRHNSEQDRQDDESLEWLENMIKAIVAAEHAAGAFYSAWVEGP